MPLRHRIPVGKAYKRVRGTYSYESVLESQQSNLAVRIADNSDLIVRPYQLQHMILSRIR
ncbi:hypothetical protein CERSUDRAFT_87605 [Gelatoporia subvermispora B]|uniref:Uncharacterized protein n=1 Tax=Ceriporiopsis subvermispora (strain B) TaxID=914234 RepID=M2PBE2_CERS8|nr:hypothetical protein CERSUDRAFT_87605 [Gelatoporia subvermispora B]